MLIAVLAMSFCVFGNAQQAYHIGNENNNQFHEVKMFNGKLYAVGNTTDVQGLRYGTVAEIDLFTGAVLWITRLEIPSDLLDLVFAGDEFIIAVGRTEPIQSATGAWMDNQCLATKFDFSGTHLLTRVYDFNAQQQQQGGRESFHKIIANPQPADAAFPFYIAGAVDSPFSSPNSLDDLIVTNIDFDLNQLFTSRMSAALGTASVDDELSHVFMADPSGNMVLMGTVNSGNGPEAVAFYIQNNGVVIGGSERRYTPDLQVIRDAIVLPNRDYVVVGQRGAAATILTNNFIMRMRGDLQTIGWTMEVPEHQRFVEIIQHEEDYYVIMEENTTGSLRYVVHRIKDNGFSAIPTLVWSKTFHDNDNQFSHPFMLSAGSQLVYGNSRKPDATAFITAGYGAQDIVLTTTDPDMTVCLERPFPCELLPIQVDPTQFSIQNTFIDAPHLDITEALPIQYASRDVCESSCPSDCVTSTININTGFDHTTNTTYSPGDYDAFWTLVQSPDAGITVPRPAYVVSPNAAWSTQTNTEWISAYPFANFNQNNTPPATPYSFQFCFCVCEDNTQVTFDLSAYADNNVFVDLYDDVGGFITDLVDVTSTGTSAFQTPPETASVTTTLNEGTYCIRADLHNLSAVAMGFNMMGTITGGSLIEPLCCSDANYITGVKFKDANCNGHFDGPGVDPLLPGWDIQVCDALNNVVATATTDALGFYVIPNLPPGTYTVKEVNQPGWVQTYPAGGSYTVTIGPGEVVGDIDFGNVRPDECDCVSVDYVNTENPNSPDDCCFNLIINTTLDNYYTGIRVTPQGGSFNSWSIDPNWSPVGTPSASGIWVRHNSGAIAAGTHVPLNICVDGTTTILVEWMVGDDVICEEEITIECGGPCEDLMAMFHYNNNKPDECCWFVDLKNFYGNNITRFEMTSMTPGVIFDNAVVNSGYTWDVPNTTMTNLSVNHGGGNLPIGTFPNAIEFCLANTTSAPILTQVIKFRWYEQIPGTNEVAICEDEITLDCDLGPPPHPCWEIVEERIECDENGNYVYKFRVINNSGLTADHVLLYNIAPSGFTFDDIYPSFPPVPPGGTSDEICLLITPTNPVNVPTNVCFDVALFGTSPNGDSYPCCFSEEEHCITLEPCCDPCEGTDVIAHSVQVDPTQETCCWSLDLVNECEPSIFTKVEIEVTTPGVSFGSHWTGGTNPGDWNNPISSPTVVQWAHNSGHIPNGALNNIINFCLDDIDNPSEVPQTVVVKWISTDPNGIDRVECEEVLTFQCEFEDYNCAEVLDEHIVCNPDGTYTYCLTIENTSTDMHDATHILLNVTSPTGVTFSPDAFPVSLPYGATTTICTTISSTGTLNPGDKITFDIRLANLTAADHWCCFESTEHCVTIPECPDDCCPPPSVFPGWVQQGFVWTADCYDLTATPVHDFDENCDEITWIWGDGSPNTVVAGNVNVTHSYPGPGTYILCMIVTRYDASGNICAQEEFCREITIEECCCPISPNEFGAWVGQGFNFALDCRDITTKPVHDFDESCDEVTWDWGDGTPNTITVGDNVATHTYAVNGTYVVCMTVRRYDDTGMICAEAQFCHTIVIECPEDCCDISPNLFADWVSQGFSWTADCEDLTIHTNYDFDEDCDEVTYIWGDGSPNTVVAGNAIVTHTFPGPGAYTVCIIVRRYSPTGAICMEAEYCETIPIEPCDDCCPISPNLFAAWVNQGFDAVNTNCLEVTATPIHDFDENCDEVRWDWGDGSPIETSVGNTPITHTYPAPGPYVICMEVVRYDENGDICAIHRVYQDIYVEPCGCPCDDEFYQAVGAGFNIFGFSCYNRTFVANNQIDPNCDEVEWIVVQSGSIIASGTGMSWNYTFPGNGVYRVCMLVTRTSPTGEICKAYICRKIKINCIDDILVVNTASNILSSFALNPFTSGGDINRNNTGWTTAMGTPTIIEDTGCDEDDLYAELAGNKDVVDGLQHQVSLDAASYYNLSFCFRYPTSLYGAAKPGTELVFRASKTPQTTPDCDGECMEIARYSLPDNPGDTWGSIIGTTFYTASLSGTAYITVHIENGIPDDGTDASKTFINIDKIVMTPQADECDDVDVTVQDDDEHVLVGVPYFHAQNDLFSSVTIGGDAVAVYKAGNSINLDPGFEVQLGVEFTAEIDDCTFPSEFTNDDVEERDESDNDDTENLITGYPTALYAYPNPFADITTLEYQLAEDAQVEITVYNMQGALMRTLLPAQTRIAGKYQMQFDGSSLTDGIYYVRMRTGQEWITQKLVLLRR